LSQAGNKGKDAYLKQDIGALSKIPNFKRRIRRLAQ
jgi:hypothetical protein